MRAFESVHPAAAFAYFISVLLVAMFTAHPVLLCEALLGAVLFCAILSAKGFWKNMASYVPLFAIIALSNPLFSHNGVTMLFFLNGNPVTLEAVLYGADIAVMLIAVIYWFQCYSFVMTSDKFLYLFGKAIPKLSLVLSMALRFIPLFKAQLIRVNRAQKAMGLYSGKSFTDKLRSAGRVLLALITWSLENAVETGDSMRARGYGLHGRSHFALFRFTGRDGVLLGISAALTGLTLTGRALGGADFAFYPRITGISTAPLSLAVYLAFGALTLLPFIIETEESLKWTYFVSKI
ncbi:MAG: energy-coupling factor transporter transmembrane protein EcfT [Oscillospiraceae bacterium]|jgi:energy-coupling factor transport system permease protein|nr:energy-coupling factor transporter transmembrane protein EcfT [Oscillospiraceae bacterium]